MEQELGMRSTLNSLFLLNSYFWDIVFATMFCAAAETAISGVHKLLGTGGVPTYLTLLFWWWLTVSSVFTGRSAGTSYSQITDSPLSPIPAKLYSFCGPKSP